MGFGYQAAVRPPNVNAIIMFAGQDSFMVRNLSVGILSLVYY
jgi:hypothetical protein